MRMSRAAVTVSLGISEKGDERKRTMHFDYRLKAGADGVGLSRRAAGVLKITV